MNGSARSRLSVMMFLQYAIWGAWAPILALHLNGLESFSEATDTKINLVYMTMAIASMLSPFIAGQIADRYFSTERFLAFSHFVGGILLFLIARSESFGAIFLLMLAHTFLYAPTIGLTNSISFHHLTDGEKEFPKIRSWGTIGWIIVMWVFSLFWLGYAGGVVRDCLYLAGGLSFVLAGYCFLLPHTPPPDKPENPLAFLSALKLMRNRSFAILILVSFLVATELQFYYVLTPVFFNQGGGPFGDGAVAEVLKTTEDRETTITSLQTLAEDTDPNDDGQLSLDELESLASQIPELIDEEFLTQARTLLEEGDSNDDNKLSRNELVALAEANGNAKRVLDFQNELVEEKGALALPEQYVGPVLTLGQLFEILVLLILPFSLKALGFRATIAIGIAAWSLRYFVFALGRPVPLVLATQTLHGFGFAFFFVGGQVFCDRIASKDIKASAQSFHVFVTMGAGMLVSSLIAGPISDYFQRNWHVVFLVPALITAVCTAALLVFFRDEPPIDEAEVERAEARLQSTPEAPSPSGEPEPMQ